MLAPDPKIVAAFLTVQVGDPDFQRRGIWGLFAGTFNGGRFRAELDRYLVGDDVPGYGGLCERESQGAEKQEAVHCQAYRQILPGT